ncbi:MAG: hypothetical protein ACRDD1_21130, partial [Planctomycetia bacterium]
HTTGDHAREGVEVSLRIARDLAEHPRLYRYIPGVYCCANWWIERGDSAGIDPDKLETLNEAVVDFGLTVGIGVPGAQGVATLLVEQLAVRLAAELERAADPSRPTVKLYFDQWQMLRDRLEQMRPATSADLRRWLPDLRGVAYPQLPPSKRMALKHALGQLQAVALYGAAPLSFRSLARLADHCPQHPVELFWKTGARLSQLFGDAGAKTLLRKHFFKQGFQWIGQARRLLRRRPTNDQAAPAVPRQAA